MAATAAKPSQDPHTDIVADAALAALEKSGGNQMEAAKALAARAKRVPEIKAALLEPLLEYACAQAVGVQIRRFRERVWNPPEAPANDRSAALQLMAAEMLSNFPLPGGMMLGDATRADIAKAAHFYETQAKDMAHKGRWLQLVGQGLPDGKRVRDVLSEDRLHELKNKAA